MSTVSQIAEWDIVLSRERNPDREVIIKIFKGYFKKWAFQLEKGDSGYEHWQCRGSLIKKRRLQEILPVLKEAGLVTPHMSPMHDVGGANVYCLKEDTRIDGPWTDKDVPPPVRTKQIESINVTTLYPWQQDIRISLQTWDDRSINVLYCKPGCCGKSGFSEWMEFEGMWYEIPMMRLMEDIMQCVMSIPPMKAYCVDMPRAMKKEKLFDFYSGIECLKNGVAYDKRYHFKKRRMDRPHIWIMSNNVPDAGLMSRDRWKIWCIDNRSQKLVPYVAEDEP
jgi:hypothetical protein